MVVATGTYSSGGTVSSSSAWSGAIATFIATPMLTLSGTAATNYTAAGVTGSVTINALPETVAARSNTKTYDGTTTCTNTPSLTPGLVGGDTSTALSETYLAKDVGAGNLEIDPAAITITDGNGGANYTVTYTTNLTGTITAKALTITGLTAVSRAYNGTSTAGLTTGIGGLPGTGVGGDGDDQRRQAVYEQSGCG